MNESFTFLIRFIPVVIIQNIQYNYLYLLATISTIYYLVFNFITTFLYFIPTIDYIMYNIIVMYITRILYIIIVLFLFTEN